MQPVHQNTSKLWAAQRKQDQLKKERKKRGKSLEMAASFKEAPHRSAWITCAIVCCCYSGKPCGEWDTMQLDPRMAARGGPFPAGDEVSGGYSQALIGWMPPLPTNHRAPFGTNHRPGFGALDPLFCSVTANKRPRAVQDSSENPNETR